MRTLKRWKRKERVSWSDREERDNQEYCYGSCKTGKGEDFLRETGKWKCHGKAAAEDL